MNEKIEVTELQRVDNSIVSVSKFDDGEIAG